MFHSLSLKPSREQAAPSDKGPLRQQSCLILEHHAKFVTFRLLDPAYRVKNASSNATQNAYTIAGSWKDATAGSAFGVQ